MADLPGIPCSLGTSETPPDLQECHESQSGIQPAILGASYHELENILGSHYHKLIQRLDAWLVRQEGLVERTLLQCQTLAAANRTSATANRLSDAHGTSHAPSKMSMVSIAASLNPFVSESPSNQPPERHESPPESKPRESKLFVGRVSSNPLSYVPGIHRNSHGPHELVHGRRGSTQSADPSGQQPGNTAHAPAHKAPGEKKPICNVEFAMPSPVDSPDMFDSPFDTRSEDVGKRSVTARQHRSAALSGVKISAWRLKLYRMVMGVEFEVFSALLIGSNAVLIGVEVDYLANHPSYSDFPNIFRVLGNVYSLLFLIELVLRIMAHGFVRFYSSNSLWHFLDTGIVFFSILELFFDVLAATSDYESGSGSISHLRILRIIRMTRLARVFRIVRVVRFIRPLKMLIFSIMHTMKSVFWALVLLIMIFYVYGSLFTQATTDYFIHVQKDSQNVTASNRHKTVLFKYWGTLPRSMYTLFQCISNGISWVEAEAYLSDISSFWVVLLNAFIFVTVFAVLNVVTGIFCQSAIDSAKLDHETVIQAQLLNKKTFNWHLKQTFNIIDKDESGTITWEEFDDRLRDPEFAAYINSLDLDVDDTRALFDLLDCDEQEEIELEEFAKGIQKLRGNAQAIELAKVMSIITKVETNVAALLTAISEGRDLS